MLEQENIYPLLANEFYLDYLFLFFSYHSCYLKILFKVTSRFFTFSKNQTVDGEMFCYFITNKGPVRNHVNQVFTFVRFFWDIFNTGMRHLLVYSIIYIEYCKLRRDINYSKCISYTIYIFLL